MQIGLTFCFAGSAWNSH